MKPKAKFKTAAKIPSTVDNRYAVTPLDHIGAYSSHLVYSSDDLNTGRFKIGLYRFLRDNIPLLNACIWTWSRLSSAPGRYQIEGTDSSAAIDRAAGCLDDMLMRLYPYKYHRQAGTDSFLPLLFNTLYTDGAFAGLLILNPDGSGVDRFRPIDTAAVKSSTGLHQNDRLIIQTATGDHEIDSPDFYYLGLNATVHSGLGQSILAAVPFVAYIEQQLVDDMRKTARNAGYHRLHVHITPPEKLSGESDDKYTERANEYFDETVSMINSCRPEDNPVTWDNVKIEHIGPGVYNTPSGSWFLNHRTMVEEICAGTNLSPFMLGYNYGTTHNWAQFKYDLVMRQVISVQRQTARFLEWIGDIELALHGHSCRCRYVFDNALSYLAADRSRIEKDQVDNLLKLYEAGLIDRDEAARKAGDLI